MGYKLTELTPHPGVEGTGQVRRGRALWRAGLLLSQGRGDYTLVLRLGLLLLRVHRRLLWLLGLRLLLLVHHVLRGLLHMLLLLGRLRLLLGLLIVRLLGLHVRVLRVHLVVHLGVDQGRTVGAVEDAALVVDRGRLELAGRVDDGRGGVTVDRGRGVPHVADHPRVGGVRPVAGHVHAVLLLLLVVGRVPDVHAVVGREARVGHARLLTRGRGRPVVVARYALAKHARVAGIRGLLGLLLHRLLLLRDLNGRAVVLLVLVRMLDPAISQIWDVRIRKIRTHAMAMSVWLLRRPVTSALLV